jgi:hypothetical protein
MNLMLIQNKVQKNQMTKTNQKNPSNTPHTRERDNRLFLQQRQKASALQAPFPAEQEDADVAPFDALKQYRPLLEAVAKRELPPILFLQEEIDGHPTWSSC